jgi:hypothetical protein
MYKTNQERALAELAKKQKAERKKRPMSSEQLDRFLLKQGRACGMLDGYKGPNRIDCPEMMDFITGGGLLGLKK